LSPDFGFHVTMSEVGAGFVFIHSGEHVGSARHADGGGVVVFVEDDAFAAELIDVRRLDFGITVTTDG